VLTVIKFKGDVRQNIADSATDMYEGLLHMVALDYIPGADETMLYCFNMELAKIEQLFCKGDWFWKHAEMLDNTTNPTDKNLNSLLEFIEVFRITKPKVNYTPQELKDRTVKKYSIYLESCHSGINLSSSEDFDSLDELKESLKNEHRAKRLIPVHYTPWDSKVVYDENSCEVDNLTLLYLYQYRCFETGIR
jgi:hypothetical protein